MKQAHTLTPQEIIEQFTGIITRSEQSEGAWRQVEDAVAETMNDAFAAAKEMEEEDGKTDFNTYVLSNLAFEYSAALLLINTIHANLSLGFARPEDADRELAKKLLPELVDAATFKMLERADMENLEFQTPEDHDLDKELGKILDLIKKIK